jgi:outer membrane biosynthesis protein TonB
VEAHLERRVKPLIDTFNKMTEETKMTQTLESAVEAPKVEDAMPVKKTPVKKTPVKKSAPVADTLKTGSKDSEGPVPAAAPEKVPTDVREKLAKKTDESTDPFVPQTLPQLERAAKEIASENGFDLNRGTSIGARLMARAQKR